MAITDDEILGAIEAGESRRFEFKSPRLRTVKTQWAEVLRAILGMANQRGGGFVFIGVDDDRSVRGLSDEQAATWRREQSARLSAARSALPAPNFDVGVRPITIGDEPKLIAVIEVRPITDLPVICTRHVRSPQHGAEPLLRVGALYVRTDVPETVEVADYAQMRELIDLATENGVRRFVGTSERVGMASSDKVRSIIQETVDATVAAIGGLAVQPQTQPAEPNHLARFNEQRQDFDNNE